MRYHVTCTALIAGVLSIPFACNHAELLPTQKEAASEPPNPRSVKESPAKTRTPRQRLKASGQLGPGRGTLVIDVKPPRDAKLTEDSPLVVEAKASHIRFPKKVSKPLHTEDLPLRLPLEVEDGALGPAELYLSYYWCGNGPMASCKPERAQLEIELDLSGSAAGGEAYFSHRPAAN